MFVVFLERRTQLRLLAAVLVLLATASARLGTLAYSHAWQVESGLAPIRRVDTSRAVVALSFDVVAGETTLRQVLEILGQRQLRATFFVEGGWAQQHPELLEKLSLAGHEVANGGYGSERHPRLGPEGVTDSIRATHEELYRVLGAEPTPLFRPPQGYSNRMVVETALQEGYHTVLWSLDSRDSVTLNAARTIKLVCRRARAGDILRFSASDAGHDAVAILEGIIAGLGNQGLRIKPVGDLLRQEGD